MKKRASLGMAGRAVVVTLGAVMTATSVAAPAQAAGEWWDWISDAPTVHLVRDYGAPDDKRAPYLAYDAAERDLPGWLRPGCRHSSQTVLQTVASVNDGIGYVARNFCKKSRATG
ncbi:hypothetical protein [Amycolatopsis sp. NPDC059657]|uniref:hypothetical protein n=1 Tax=Amycolatopsis sp. NPDC059657 TaxID=3346899 RepID=UPI00366EA7E2